MALKNTGTPIHLVWARDNCSWSLAIRLGPLAGQRADAVKKYLAGKGIADSHVDGRTAGGQAAADKQNRRIDIVRVPEGATYKPLGVLIRAAQRSAGIGAHERTTKK